MGPLDSIYANGIDTFVKLIGPEAAFNVLLAEAKARLDSTMKQALSMEGAFAAEAAAIVRDYPEWSIRFTPDEGNGFQAQIRSPSHSKGDEGRLQAEGAEISRRITETFAKHNKVNLPGVKATLTMSKVPVAAESDGGDGPTGDQG